MCFFRYIGENNEKGGIKMARSSNKNLDSLKWSSATEAGINLKQGYNGDLAAKDAGRIGGQMVRKMIQYAEGNMPEVRNSTTGTRF
jgi:hypothetical protein